MSVDEVKAKHEELTAATGKAGLNQNAENTGFKRDTLKNGIKADVTDGGRANQSG